MRFFIVNIALCMFTVRSYAVTYTRTTINTYHYSGEFIIADNICYMCHPTLNTDCSSNANSTVRLNNGDIVSALNADQYAGTWLPGRTPFKCNKTSSSGQFTTTYSMGTVRSYTGDYIIVDNLCIMCAPFSSGACSVVPYITWFKTGDRLNVTEANGVGGASGPVTYNCNQDTTGKFSILAPCSGGYYGSTSCLRCPDNRSSIAGSNISVTDCYIPAYTSITNSKGTYRHASNCYYTD